MTEPMTNALVRGRATSGVTGMPGASRADVPFARRLPFRMRRVWLISFLVWTIPAVAFTGLAIFAPDHGVDTVLRIFLRQGLPWYYWSVLTPLILSLADTLPLDRAPRRRAFVLHACNGIVSGYFFGLIWLIVAMLGSPPNGGAIISGRSILFGMAFFIPFGCGVYATIAAVGYAMYFSRRLREREVMASHLQSQLKEAQLGALRMQLQPHFLFNTLNTIAMLVREGETQTSVRMLARLSDLLRHLLEDQGDQEVPVREELDFLARYLEIEQLRFRDRLHVQLNVDDGTRDAFIPNLVLQPIVENAIQHGISRRAAAGSLQLDVSRENGTLLLTVRDDGPGLKPGFSLDALTGIGLRNTAARLHFLYGDNATMDVRNADEHGTVVTLRIPYHETPVRRNG
jgi:two-component system LytT family sensor kinase